MIVSKELLRKTGFRRQAHQSISLAGRKADAVWIACEARVSRKGSEGHLQKLVVEAGPNSDGV